MKLYKHSDILRAYPDFFKPRTFISWVEKGLLSPVVKASGTGTRHQYSSRNVMEVGVIRELVSYGVPHDIISFAMKQLSELSEKEFSEQNGFDLIMVIHRSRAGPADRTHLYTVRFGSRSKFNREAGGLIFGSSMPSIPSAIVISLADIWKSIQARI